MKKPLIIIAAMLIAASAHAKSATQKPDGPLSAKEIRACLAKPVHRSGDVPMTYFYSTKNLPPGMAGEGYNLTITYYSETRFNHIDIADGMLRGNDPRTHVESSDIVERRDGTVYFGRDATDCS